MAPTVNDNSIMPIRICLNDDGVIIDTAKKNRNIVHLISNRVTDRKTVFRTGDNARLILPSNDLVHDGTLFIGGAAQINPCCFDALMAHQIGQQRDIIEFFQKILCITMPE